MATGSGRRVLWTFTDQALSSLTNAALTIVVARAVGAPAFGAFALALVTFGFVIGLARATIADAYVVRFTDADPSERRRAIGQATGAAAAFGLLTGGVCAGVGLVLPDAGSRAAMIALALSLPGLLVQDTWRFVFFAAGRPAGATLSDAVWAVLQFGGLAVLFAAGVASVFWTTLVWGLSALVAALPGIVGTGIRPAPGQTRAWVARTRELSSRMGLVYVLNMGAVNLATYLVTALVGLIAAGALRAGQTLLGPLTLFRSGLDSFVLPVMARAAQAGRSLVGVVAATSAAATAVSGVWVGVLLLLPASAGSAVLGDSWSEAARAVPGLGLLTVAQAVVLGAALGLKALRRPDLVLRVTVIQAPLILTLGCCGAWAAGVAGAAWGFGVAQTIGAVLTWFTFRVADAAERPWAAVPELSVPSSAP